MKSDGHSCGASTEVAEADQQPGDLVWCIEPFKVRYRLYKTDPYPETEEFTLRLDLIFILILSVHRRLGLASDAYSFTH